MPDPSPTYSWTERVDSDVLDPGLLDYFLHLDGGSARTRDVPGVRDLRHHVRNLQLAIETATGMTLELDCSIEDAGHFAQLGVVTQVPERKMSFYENEISLFALRRTRRHRGERRLADPTADRAVA